LVAGEAPAEEDLGITPGSTRADRARRAVHTVITTVLVDGKPIERREVLRGDGES